METNIVITPPVSNDTQFVRTNEIAAVEAAANVVNSVIPSLLSKTITITPETKQTLKTIFNYDNVKVYEDQDADAPIMGSLGNPIFMPIVLNETTYQVQSGTEAVKTIRIPEMVLPVAIIEMQRAKNIEMTPVEGLDGTVKEYGSKGDWNITIRGMLYNNDDTYPAKELRDLLKFDDCPVSVEVSCDLFFYVGVKKISISRIRLVPTPEFEEVQAFELDCFSDASNYELIKRKS